jgi:D-alanine-D-alanine ligase
MEKIRIAVLCGGRSGEHEVSLVSGSSVAKALDPSKYDVTLVGIDPAGKWKVLDTAKILSGSLAPEQLNLREAGTLLEPRAYASENFLTIHNQKPFDVIFPVLHGTYGEDGTIQGLFELADVPYVGSGVVGSSVGMDKDVSRRLLDHAGIPVVPTLTFRASDGKSMEERALEAERSFGYPYFVKPANMGSSVGVHKVKAVEQALAALEDAFNYDNKVLIEKAIPARELECAVLEGEPTRASGVGEIIPTHEFYSYEAKYQDENGAELKIPAELTAAQVEEIQLLSLKAFDVLELRGLARVDFFMDKNSGQLYLNEVNTMPGFTKISMYPKLWAAAGLKYPELLDHLVQLALKRHHEKAHLKTEFAGARPHGK